ncbi:MAG: isoleucine--tRNA ligase [Ruminococcus sp.]|jgi:isoleucyl-tRNA synthetase|nr:isoleucine--tRNA ligase [Ruminococcus sp.]
MDYNSTLNLPKTDFPMRANLPKKEPEILEKWEQNRTYYQMVENNKGKPLYVFHDGPPYANGEIHIGTALNKILKDIIVKHRNMSGYQAPYVPGWDTHGLPIELKALKSMGADKTLLTPAKVRKVCKDFALSHVENQMRQFKRLGTFGKYERPYLTLRPEYEARQVEVFGKMAKKGYVYKGLKPVYWCPDCRTALAEAEIEYSEDPCKSIYVKFKVTDGRNKLNFDNLSFVIWTTTTWTIPGNLAICLGADYDYSVIKTGDEHLVMATELAESVLTSAGITEFETVYTCKGGELEGIITKHPLYDRTSPIILGSHVTLESGTGCVHTAPGYGVEDYEVCRKYPEIDILVCVDADGLQTAESGPYVGLNTDDANKAIFADLEKAGAVFNSENIKHKYPHCWRCRKPIIYRATEQWFCSVEEFKAETVSAIDSVEWIPSWGGDRIKKMVEDRSDWCISRQRTWGVPIPIIYCKDCGEYIVNDETISAISAMFRNEGADSWWEKDTAEFIPSTVKCPKCGCGSFTKEYDIMDVWFDSGVSHTAVLDEYDELHFPADLYLEGGDQYRGWFQSSLLTSVVYNECAPYKAVCAHGWVVDGKGRKMSKSLGNGVEPGEICDKFGADILRGWVASSDYHSDIRFSNDIVTGVSDAYKKIRNTARFILGNLKDFTPTEYSPADLEEIDRYALFKLDELVKKVNLAYEKFDFHIVYHSIYNFCVVDMSNFYLDIIKDRLYCESDALRKRAQYAIYKILSTLTLAIAPIFTFTAEEIWGYLPKSDNVNSESVFFNEIPKEVDFGEVDSAKWGTIEKLRDDVKKSLEIARNDKVIGSSLEAKVIISGDFDLDSELLKSVFIVSEVEIKPGNEDIKVEKAQGEKCIRCWNYSTTVGQNSDHPEICSRCASVI